MRRNNLQARLPANASRLVHAEALRARILRLPDGDSLLCNLAQLRLDVLVTLRDLLQLVRRDAGATESLTIGSLSRELFEHKLHLSANFVDVPIFVDLDLRLEELVLHLDVVDVRWLDDFVVLELEGVLV